MNKLFILIIAIAAIGCAEQKNVPENFDYGTTENGEYVNSYFDMVLNFDPSWEIQDQQRLEQLIEQGGEVVYGDDEEFEKTVKASMVNTANLMTIFKYELGAEQSFNPSFALIAENTNNFPGLHTGADYLNHVKELLVQTQMDYAFDDDVVEYEIGNSIFYVMHLELSYMGRLVNQDYLTTIKNGFALSMVVSYTTEEEKAEVYEIIDSIEI